MIRLILTFFLLGAGIAQAAEQSTALVTGANRGIGLELATQLKGAGYSVIGTARKPAEAKELKALGVRVEQLDVTDAASVAALAKRLDGAAIDLLINNAGVSGDGSNSIRELDTEAMSFTYSVNAIGPMRVTQALLPNLDAGKGKTIVHISSVMGSIANNWGGAYDYRASKTALNMLNSSLAKELGKEGYTSVVMHPGWVQTRMGGESAPVKPTDSVAGLLTVIAGLDKTDNGKFYDYEGKPIPW